MLGDWSRQFAHFWKKSINNHSVRRNTIDFVGELHAVQLHMDSTETLLYGVSSIDYFLSCSCWDPQFSEVQIIKRIQ